MRAQRTAVVRLPVRVCLRGGRDQANFHVRHTGDRRGKPMTKPLPTARLTEYLRTQELVRWNLSAASMPHNSWVHASIWSIRCCGRSAMSGGSTNISRCGGWMAGAAAGGCGCLYNSSTVPHDTRWDLPLPSLQGTLDYMARVQDAMVQRLGRSRVRGSNAPYLLTSTTKTCTTRPSPIPARRWVTRADLTRRMQGGPPEAGRCPAMSPSPAARFSSARRPARLSCSTTRSGRIPSTWRRSAWPERQ